MSDPIRVVKYELRVGDGVGDPSPVHRFPLTYGTDREAWAAADALRGRAGMAGASLGRQIPAGKRLYVEPVAGGLDVGYDPAAPTAMTGLEVLRAVAAQQGTVQVLVATAGNRRIPCGPVSAADLLALLEARPR